MCHRSFEILAVLWSCYYVLSSAENSFTVSASFCLLYVFSEFGRRYYFVKNMPKLLHWLQGGGKRGVSVQRKEKARQDMQEKVACVKKKIAEKKKKKNRRSLTSNWGALSALDALLKLEIKLLLFRRGEVDVQTAVLVTAETARLWCM
jgi:hypothetical protein